MDIDDHDFPLVRKNLNIISVLILILAYTNAKLNSLSFLGIQIDLDAHRLYVAIFVLYLYFIWRFFTKLPIRSGFWKDFVVFYLNSDEGVKSKHNYKTHSNAFLSENPNLKKAIENDATISLISSTIIRFSQNPLTSLRLIVAFSTDRKFGDNESGNIHVHRDFEVSKYFLVKKLLLFNIKYDKFGDYLFPVVPIIVNFTFFIVSAEWQGGVKSLWF